MPSDLPPEIHDNVPRSAQFDDVYFSVEDGLAETRHVFLSGNTLPAIWRGQERFTIGETGFGTGLNFLAALNLWHATPAEYRPDHLHFISFEKYPLTRDYIHTHLAHWTELAGELEAVLAVYPKDLSDGVYDLAVSDAVTLTLVFGDINAAIPLVDAAVDCWFLDGFKPSSNPDMWSDTVFSNMARLSTSGARFATFTAAGFVRRGLAAQGFTVNKIKGYGRKREMCVGFYGDDVGGDMPCA